MYFRAQLNRAGHPCVRPCLPSSVASSSDLNVIYISEQSVMFLKLASSLKRVLFLPLDAVMVAVL